MAIEESEALDDLKNKMDLKMVYKRLLELLRPNEDIGKTLKRLNSEKGIKSFVLFLLL